MPPTVKITTHLWYDKEAIEAGKLYTSAFHEVFGTKLGASGVKSISQIHHTPSGDVDIVSIELAGQAFMLISAGPMFKFTPAISFLVSCESAAEVDALWAKLSPGGTVMMDLGKYPFGERFGWTQDKFGLSWQLLYTGTGTVRQRVTPFLMYVGKNLGRAEEAMRLYTAVFRDSKIGSILRYGKGEAPDKEGTVKFGPFTIEGKEFIAMESAHPHNFTFTEAISFVVNCDTQQEIDHYWSKLSADPSAEACGWLKDKFGVSWQVTPTSLQKMMADPDKKKVARVTEAFLTMKKFDLAALEKAYQGT